MARPKGKEVTRSLTAKKYGLRYTDKTKLEAVIAYSECGSLRSVARAMGIPEETMRAWHLQDWWKEMEYELKIVDRKQLFGQMKTIKDKAVKIVEDRLENGDFFYDQKTGEMVRKPIAANVANEIMRTSMDKQLQIEELNMNEKRIETEEKVADRLAKLSLEFKKFAQAKQIEGVSFAIHDQREEGLPEGESLGSQERGPTDQGSSGSESRESAG